MNPINLRWSIGRKEREAMGRKTLEEILKEKNEIIDKVLKLMCGMYVIGKPEEEITKDILEDFKKENVPEKWILELIELFKRKIVEYRSTELKELIKKVKNGEITDKEYQKIDNLIDLIGKRKEVNCMGVYLRGKS